MSFWTKWKNALLKRLSFFCRKDRHDNKGENSSPAAGGLNASTGERKILFSKRNIILLGVYLVLVGLFLSLAVVRWGKVPFLEIPGVKEEGVKRETEVEREIGNIIPGEGTRDEGDFSGAAEGEILVEKPAGIKENHLFLTEEEGLDPDAGSESLWDKEADREEEGRGIPEEDDGSLAVQAVDFSLLEAASPLLEWSLHSPFNSYNREALPSGGFLHRFSRGVYFRATPGAPVSALWDGYVVKTGGEDSPYSNSVLIEHDGGYTSYYGNLWEVWVEEGSFINRGESIGLMPHNSSRETVAVTTSKEDQGGRPRQVPLRTILRGYRDGEIVELWSNGGACYGSGNQPNADEKTGIKKAQAPLFHEESPLLYLEVRYRGNSFLDPLKFIPVRN